MILSFFRRILQLFTFALFITIIYQNIYTVPDNHIGILIENNGATGDTYLKPGYHWVTTGFVPEKWALHSINVNPFPLKIEFKKDLIYSEYLNLPENFHISFDLQMKYKLNIDSIKFFRNYYGLEFSHINQYIHDRTRLLIELQVLDYYKKPEDLTQVQRKVVDFFKKDGEFEKQWRELFAEESLELEKYELMSLQIPPSDIYFMNIRDIRPIIKARQEASVQNILTEAEIYRKRQFDQLDLDKARNFAQIIKNNPEILQYYKIDKIYPSAEKIIIPEGYTQTQSDKEKTTGTVPPISRTK